MKIYILFPSLVVVFMVDKRAVTVYVTLENGFRVCCNFTYCVLNQLYEKLIFTFTYLILEWEYLRKSISQHDVALKQ